MLLAWTPVSKLGSCLPRSNVKPTFFQDRKLSFWCFCSKKDWIYSFFKQNSGSNKTFSISTRKFWAKSFCSGLFPNFFVTTKCFLFYFKNPSAICNVLVSFWYNFFQTGKKNLEIVCKSSILFALKPKCMETFRSDNKLTLFCSCFVFKL